MEKPIKVNLNDIAFDDFGGVKITDKELITSIMDSSKNDLVAFNLCGLNLSAGCGAKIPVNASGCKTTNTTCRSTFLDPGQVSVFEKEITIRDPLIYQSLQAIKLENMEHVELTVQSFKQV